MDFNVPATRKAEAESRKEKKKYAKIQLNSKLL